MPTVDVAPTPVGNSTLIAPSRRVGALVVVLVGLVAFTALALSVAGSRTPTGVDDAVAGWLYRNVGDRVATGMVWLSDPKVTTSALVLVVLGGAVARRWDVVAWGVIAPTTALVLAEIVLKPLVGRQLLVDITEDPYYQTHPAPAGYVPGPVAGFAFPSGHETGVTAATAELALLVLLVPLARRLRAALLVVLALWTLVAAAGLVRNHYHFATDTVGAILLTAAWVVALALAIDVLVERRRRRQFTCRS